MQLQPVVLGQKGDQEAEDQPPVKKADQRIPDTDPVIGKLHWLAPVRMLQASLGNGTEFKLKIARRLARKAVAGLGSAARMRSADADRSHHRLRNLAELSCC
jgi:hypothetical protein